MKIINHIWKYITNPDYRLKVYLKRLNKKFLKEYGYYNIPPGLLEKWKEAHADSIINIRKDEHNPDQY